MTAPLHRRLTCAIVICRDIPRAASLGVYVFRADGRKGALRRGSPALGADLLLPYAPLLGKQGVRGPAKLEFDDLWIARWCERRDDEPSAHPQVTPETVIRSGDTLFPRSTLVPVPARRVEANDLQWNPGRAPQYIDCCDRHQDTPIVGRASGPDDDRSTLARTANTRYFTVYHCPVAPPATLRRPDWKEPRAWTSWVESVLGSWEQNRRDDQYGEPSLHCLPQDLSDQIRIASKTWRMPCPMEQPEYW